MERRIILSVLLWVISGLVCTKASADSIPQVNQQDKTIVLDNGTKLSWQNICDEYFTTTTGFYNKGNAAFVREINGAQDTTYINCQWDEIVQYEHITSDGAGYILQRFDLSAPNWKKYAQLKTYNEEKRRWQIYSEAVDGSWIDGGRYCIDNQKFEMLDEDSTKNDFFIGACLFFCIFSAYGVIFIWGFGASEQDYHRRPWWIAMIGLLLSLGGAIFIESYIQRQLFLPLLIIIATSILFKIPMYVGKVRYISQCLIGVIIVSVFAYKQFIDIYEVVKFNDGKELNIKWKRGTCLINRHYIKQMLKNMLPIKVNPFGKEYGLYVSKYEFSQDDFAVVVGDPMSWLNVLFKSNRSLDDLSFRESQIMMELLTKITNVQFDFLSYNEWEAVSQYKNHSPNNLDFDDVDERDVSDNGLVNIRENMPEYTSTYYRTYKLGLAADTLLPSYNNVMVARSAYKCTDSINISAVNKNIRDGRVGFRLI